MFAGEKEAHCDHVELVRRISAMSPGVKHAAILHCYSVSDEEPRATVVASTGEPRILREMKRGEPRELDTVCT